MALNIEKMRADMHADAEKLKLIYKQDERQQRHQTWTIVLQALALFVGGCAAGATWLKFFYP